MGKSLGIGWTTVVPEKMSENLLKIGKYMVKVGILKTGTKYEILYHGLQLVLNEVRELITSAKQQQVPSGSASGSGCGQPSSGDTGSTGRIPVPVPEVKEGGKQNG